MVALTRTLLFASVLLTACPDGEGTDGRGSPPAPTTVSPSPEGTPSPDPSPVPGESPAAIPSPAASVEQGGRYWAVYAVVAEAGSAELDEAFNRLRDLGVAIGGFGELACDRGAAEALGVDPGLHGVAVYFDRESDARAFADSLDPPPAGVARVRTFCAD
jgi:hypothetical protein